VEGGPQIWDEEEPVSVSRACISLDGTRIAAVFSDGTLCIYETTGEAICPPFKVDKKLRSVIFSRDGKLVAMGGQALWLWNVQTGEEVESFNINVWSLALSPDGTCIAAGCAGKDLDGGDMDVDGGYNIRVINLGFPILTYRLAGGA
jgi:WD40 repeat protein